MEQITIKEIAKLCGVGVSTVSRAINNHPDINQETKQKIMDVIQSCNYVPNNSARNLKRVESKTIAVLVKGVSNPFFGRIIQAMEQATKDKKYSYVLQQVDEEENEVDVAIQLEKEKRLKGIVFLGGNLTHSREKLKRITVPYVISTVNMQLPDDVQTGAVVSVDDEAESRRMVNYLIGCGHRRIAILTTNDDQGIIGKNRFAGYRRALADNGIEYDPELVLALPRDQKTYTMQKGYEIMQRFLETGTGFDAVFAISDTLAIGACRAIFDAGKHVPEDYSVAGFDGMDYAAYYHPSLTTIRQPWEEIAGETIRLLFDLIKGRSVRRRVIFEGKLLEGESTRTVQRYGND